MGVSMTSKQRARLEVLAKQEGRSMSNLIGWLIDLEWESRAAYQEHDHTENVKAQDLEPELIA